MKMKAHNANQFQLPPPSLKSCMKVATLTESLSSCNKHRHTHERRPSIMQCLSHIRLSTTQRVSATDQKEQTIVRFRDVFIREYEVVTSDNPSVPEGAGLEVRGHDFLVVGTTTTCHSQANELLYHLFVLFSSDGTTTSSLIILQSTSLKRLAYVNEGIV
jgi:hypothetical protein